MCPRDKITRGADRLWVGREGHRSQQSFFLRAPPNVLLCACLPFSSLVLHNITQGIFETIVEQAPFAIEDLMNEIEEEEEMSEDDEQEQDVPSKKLFEKPPKGEDCSVFNMACPACHISWDPCIHFLSGLLIFILAPKSVLGPAARVFFKNKHTCSLTLLALAPCAPS